MCSLLPPAPRLARLRQPPARPDTGSVARAERTVAVEPETTATDQVSADMKSPPAVRVETSVRNTSDVLIAV